MAQFLDVETAFLFICDIGEDVDDAQFTALFQALPGLKALRGPRRDRGGQKVAFADFDTEANAAAGKDRMNGYQFTANSGPITVKFSGQPKRGGDNNKGGGRNGPPPAKTQRRETPHAPPPPGGGGNHGYEAGIGGFANQGMRPGMLDPGFAAPDLFNPVMNHQQGMFNVPVPDPAQMMRASLPFQPAVKDLASQPATLYVEGLPSDATEREVSHLFRVFPGYRSIRLKPQMSRVNESEIHHFLCFVEFASELEASTCMSYLQGYVFDEKVPDRSIKLSFASTERKRRG